MDLDQMARDDAPRDEVLLDDALENRRVALAVPDTFRIDDRDRTAFTNAQAVGLRAENAAPIRQAELLQAPLQELPRGQAPFLVAAFRRRLVAAEKDVPPRDGDANRACDLSLRFRQLLSS